MQPEIVLSSSSPHALARVVRPFRERRTYARLVYLLLAIPLGCAGATVLFAGWLVTALLAVTPLVVPALLVFRWAVRLLASAEAALARNLLGQPVRPAPRPPRGRGFWGAGFGVFGDSTFWKEQAFLLVRLLPGGAVAIGLASLVGAGFGWLAAPAYYRWGDLDYGSVWHTDSFAKSLVFIPAGLGILALTAHLIGPVARAAGAVAAGLLGRDDGAVPSEAAVARERQQLLLAVRLHAAVAAGLVTLLVVIWAATSAHYFWPEWVLLPFALVLGIHAWVTLVLVRPKVGPRRLGRGFAIHAGIAIALELFLVLVWAVTSRGYFWPAWTLLGLAIPVLFHGVLKLLVSPNQAELERRIDVLTTTRAGAVDAQEAELRRIERDLHDGAQARLVALGMSIGMAEQKLADDPQAALALLAEARLGAHEALEELRDLARGIHPPVLADRGLEAAVKALAHRSAFPVHVRADYRHRTPPAVESTAYFVVAEALANAGKHADPTRLEIRLLRDGDRLTVEIEDDGRGGADPNGTGLTGLRHRVEALDGTLQVESPAGGPTTVRAELPCGS